MRFGRFSVALLLLALCSPAMADQLKIGQPAPNLNLVLMDGSHVHLADLHGKVVVLNFWATWCVPCRTELPLLDNYYRVALQRGWPLRIFAVATEDSLPESKLKPLFSAMAVPAVRRVGGVFSDFDGMPTNYVVDRSGILRYAKAGAFDLDGLNETLVPLMQEPAPAGQ